jgi:hypothetical protein
VRFRGELITSQLDDAIPKTLCSAFDDPVITLHVMENGNVFHMQIIEREFRHDGSLEWMTYE